MMISYGHYVVSRDVHGSKGQHEQNTKLRTFDMEIGANVSRNVDMDNPTIEIERLGIISEANYGRDSR